MFSLLFSGLLLLLAVRAKVEEAICPLGVCQCPLACQSVMLGLYARPLCFSYYFQPRINCSSASQHGICLSLNNETLSKCAFGFPQCLSPTTTTTTTAVSTTTVSCNNSGSKSGPVTIIDAQALGGHFWQANIYAPSCSGGDQFCEQGYFARCLERESLDSPSSC